MSSPQPRAAVASRLFRRSLAALFAGAMLAAASPAGANGMRLWTSADGKTVSAELVDATDTTVTIKAEGGREFTLAHERLSQADRDYIKAHLAAKKAEYESIVWPRPTAEEPIKAAAFKRLHGIDPKRLHSTYAEKVLLIEGQVNDVREDRAGSTPGVIVTLETESKIPMEFRFSKSSYDKDLTLLLGTRYVPYRGPYGEDEFRVSVADRGLVVERRYVTSRDGYYTAAGNWRYRNRWSEWQVVARPLTRGDIIKIRGEFVSVFNSVISFKDASLLEPAAALDRSLFRY